MYVVDWAFEKRDDGILVYIVVLMVRKLYGDVVMAVMTTR